MNPNQTEQKPSFFSAIRRRALSVWYVFCVLVLLGSGVFGLAMVDYLKRVEIIRHVAPQKADGIVVLTGGEERISESLQLLEQGMGKRLLISGVNQQLKPEALQKLWPKYEALFECCIDLDYNAEDTVGNAEESALWAQKNGFSSLLVVTAHYHLPRALLEFQSVMPDKALKPYPVISENWRHESWYTSSFLMRRLLVEGTKYWGVRMKMEIKHLKANSH